MRRFILYSVLAAYLGVPSAAAADRYGEWSLENPRSSVLTLSLKQSMPLSDKITTSELAFICDQRDKSKIVGVILIPFDGTFENKQDVIPVLIQKRNDRHDPSDLVQKWKNGTKYIFLDSKDNVDELASFLKATEANGVKSAHFFFPNDRDAGSQISNQLAINVSGFSDGFRAFQMACATSQ
jgi:hypothetical protein